MPDISIIYIFVCNELPKILFRHSTREIQFYSLGAQTAIYAPNAQNIILPLACKTRFPFGQLYTSREICENESKMRKMKSVWRGILRHFFSFRTLFFAFRIVSQGRHSCENSEDFVDYFFIALKKHEILMKCEKYTASVSYFVVCFAKNTREMRNTKSV